ncbi:MAG: hypothetical protein R3B57_07565 [Phycisphaerales bacterium]
MTAMMHQLLALGAWASPAVCVGTLLGAHGIFLLDRVKPRASMLDPADAASAPRRDALMRKHGRLLRAVVVFDVLVGAIVTGVWVSWISALAIPGGVIGVLAYAGRPPGTRGIGRLKDLPIIKNLGVAVSLVALALAMTLPAIGWSLADAWPLALGGVLLVLGDAILCDLDDEAADEAFGAETLPVTLGRGPTIAIATLLIVAGSAGLALLERGGGAGERLTWGVGPSLSAAAIVAFSPGRVKSLVDVRLAVIAVLAGGIGVTLAL